MHLARRSAATASVIALCSFLVVSSALGATAQTPAPASPSDKITTTTTTTTTTTSTTTSSTTTVPGPSTTTTTTTTTTVPGQPPPAGGNPGQTGTGGVPAVPVGGPPTTVAPKSSKAGPPTPPPDPGPVLEAVDSELDQLQAIDDYALAKDAVAATSRTAAAAAAKLSAADLVLDRAESFEGAKASASDAADSRLGAIAIALYMGVSYATPASGPQSAGSVGTVTSPEGLTGSAAADAGEMLRLIAERARHEVASADRALRGATDATSRAERQVARTEHVLATARAAVRREHQTLALVVEAATRPSVAATLDLATLPGLPKAATGAPGTGPPQAAPGTTASVPDTAATTDLAYEAALPQGTGAKPPPSPTILGPSMMTAPELAGWFASTRHKANVTVAMSRLAADYAAAGKATGVRFDLAFAQSVVETGYFSFPSYGQLTPRDNNFAGIGACDSCARGWSFPSAQDGVGAQLELLEAYASPKKVPTPLLHGAVGIGGCCPTWMKLAGKWASSLVYGISILTVYERMLAWVIPQDLVAAGLLRPVRPSRAASAGASSTARPAGGRGAPETGAARLSAY